MAEFELVGSEAMSRLVKTSKGYLQRQIYRDNIAQLSETKNLEVRPEPGESLRKVKVNVRRAANEVGIAIQYGNTVNGSLLVWRETSQRSGRRGRPRKSAEAGA